MQGYNFTERVRKILAMAREESGRLNHEYVGTEHLLLGLIREGDGVAAAVLQNLQVDLDQIRQKIGEHVKKGRSAPSTGPDLPYTTRAKKVLELAMTEARELNHSYVGTEHILLGLLREEKGIAAQVLGWVGVDVSSARTEMLRLLGSPVRQPSNQIDSQKGRELRPLRFTVRVDAEGGYWFEQHFERAVDAIAFIHAISPKPRDRPPSDGERGERNR